MSRVIIRGAAIATERAIVKDKEILVVDGRIEAIENDFGNFDAEVVDASGCIAMPGIIDLHTDALEAEITPRPGANFPLDVALQEIDAKMLCCGITTVYHSLHLGYDAATLKSKSKYTRDEVFEATRAFAATRSRSNSRIHLRFEILGVSVVDSLQLLLRNGSVDLLSFMDHTPGQGQYPKAHYLKRCMEDGVSEADALAELAKRQAVPKVSPAEIAELAKLAHSLGIPVASHDDDSPESVAANREMGIDISEFPITLEAARKARELGMHILGGASNILRGGSLSGNLCMNEAVRSNVLDGLTSDYYPPSILHAVFKLWTSGTLELHEAINLATLNPARAARIEQRVGSLAKGKDADLLIVELADRRPRVTHAFVRGNIVHHSPRIGSSSIDALDASAEGNLASAR